MFRKFIHPVEQDPDHKDRVIRNSGVISLFNTLGFASALLVDVFVAARFGLSQATDAFFVAYTLPQVLYSIILVSFNVVLVPLFTRVSIEKGREGLWTVSSYLINLSLLVFFCIGMFGVLASPVLIKIQGAGLDPETQMLGISLNRILFLLVIPLGGIEVTKAILNSLREFAFPAASILLLNLTTVLVLICFPRLGIHALAIGYVCGFWLEFFVLGIVLLTKGYTHKLRLSIRDPYVMNVLSQLRYPFLGAVFGQSNIILERFLASFLPVGLVSALGYARRILTAVNRIFLSSISTAFLPRLASQFTQNNLSEYKSSLSLAFRLAIFTSFPISAGVIGLSILLVDVLFGRGAFDYDATVTTAKLLSIFILSVPPSAIYQILNTAFYATGDPKTPFNNRVLVLLINVVLDVTLFYFLGALGLTIGFSLAWILGTIIIAHNLNHKMNFLDKELLLFGGKIGLSSLLMGGVVYYIQSWLIGVRPSMLIRFVESGLWLGVITAFGVVVFFLLALLMKVKEIKRVLRFVR